jgi:anti-sigma factor RsiW
MSYGVTSWATQAGRARAAGNSKGSGTRTAKRKRSASAQRAKKRKTTKRSTKQRRSLPGAQSSLWKSAQLAGWTDRQAFEDWAGDPSHAHEVAILQARYKAYKETGR